MADPDTVAPVRRRSPALLALTLLVVASACASAADGALGDRAAADTGGGGSDAGAAPGDAAEGTIDWTDWGRALDSTGYAGPILLECIRRLRHSPSSYKPEVLAGIARLAPR